MLQIRKYHLIDPSFHGRRRAYLFQSALATVALLLILTVEVGVGSAAINASIASSAFLVFVVPHSVAASTRRVLGGHVVGVIVGVSAYAVLVAVAGDYEQIDNESLAIAGSIGVGTSILVMAVTNTEHPPAAGTTLGLIMVGSDYGSIWFILSAATLLAVIRLILAPRLVNLLGPSPEEVASSTEGVSGPGETDR